MMTKQMVFAIIRHFLSVIIANLTPSIRQMIAEYVRSLYKQAKTTYNIWDDYFVEILASLLGIKLREEEKEKLEVESNV